MAILGQLGSDMTFAQSQICKLSLRLSDIWVNTQYKKYNGAKPLALLWYKIVALDSNIISPNAIWFNINVT